MMENFNQEKFKKLTIDENLEVNRLLDDEFNDERKEVEELLSDEFNDITNDINHVFNTQLSKNLSKQQDLNSCIANFQQQQDVLIDKNSILLDQKKIIETEKSILQVVEDLLNGMIEILNQLGLNLNKDQVELETINDFSMELNNIKTSLINLDLKIKKVKQQIDISTQELSLKNKELEHIEKAKKYYETYYKDVLDQIDEITKNQYLTQEDKEAIVDFEIQFIQTLESTNLSPEKVKEITQNFNNQLIKLKEELADFDIDWKDVFKNVAVNAGMSAGIGIVGGGPAAAGIGAIWGALSGSVGSLAKQLALQNGTNESTATGLQIVAEMISPAGITKIIGKESIEIGIKHIDDFIRTTKNSEVSRSIIKKFDDISEIKTLNSHLAGSIHPITKVIFEKEIIKTPLGKIEGVFPKFESKFDFHMPKEYFNKDGFLDISEAQQFKIFLKALAKELENNDVLKKQLTNEQIELIKKGILPREFTIHHHQDIGRYQLVDSKIHNATAHTGGASLWTTRHA